MECRPRRHSATLQSTGNPSVPAQAESFSYALGVDKHLLNLVALWREIGAALALHPDSAALTAEAQRVGSELLTECRRQGVSPVLAMLDEGEA